MTQSIYGTTVSAALECVNRAEKLATQGMYTEAHATLEKARTLTHSDNHVLLETIRNKQDALSEMRRNHILRLEENAHALFNSERFDSQQARLTLAELRKIDPKNELADSLSDQLPDREAADRERQAAQGIRREIEKLWKQAKELEDTAAGARAVEMYEQALTTASKAAGDSPKSIPLNQLKREAQKRRNRAKETWIGVPTIVADKKGQDLVDRYETLKRDGEITAAFFDANGDYIDQLPIDECILRAKEMASQFADQKAQDYLGQVRTNLLTESPGAAHDKIQEALSLAYLSDFAKGTLQRELANRIQPAIQAREKSTNKLKEALREVDDVEVAWRLLIEAEQLDSFTPGLDDARQRLKPLVQQRFQQLIGDGQIYQESEDFETAKSKLRAAVKTAQHFASYDEEFQDLSQRAQRAYEECTVAENKVRQFDSLLANIAQRSQSEPELAKKELEQLATDDTLSIQSQEKLKQLGIQVDFRLGIEQLFSTLEQQLLASSDEIELIPLEVNAQQACEDYPREKRFTSLTNRIQARRFYLRGQQLKNDPAKRIEARQHLQKAIELHGDDVAAAQQLINEISISEQQEVAIDAAIQEAEKALAIGDSELAYKLIEQYRHSVSLRSREIRHLINQAGTQWQNEIENRLENLVSSGNFIVPEIEELVDKLEQCHSLRVNEWQKRALAPAYAKAGSEMESISWEHASEFWDKAFRISPRDSKIIEGRRNAQKWRAIFEADKIFDPKQKEEALLDLDNIYSDEIAVKHRLSEFYFTQKKYFEARMAIEQAKFLADHLTVGTTDEMQSIQILDSLILEAEKIEKQKLLIQSRISGQTMVNDFWQARISAQQLLNDFTSQKEQLEQWWSDLVTKTGEQIDKQITKLSEEAGTVWKRAELICKILALQPDNSIRSQAEHLLRLTFEQLPGLVASIVDNPQGIGFGSSSDALANHINKAKDLQKLLINVTQAQDIFVHLSLRFPEITIDLGESQYKIESTLEKLRLAQDTQRKIRSQISIAIATGEWEPIEDSLEELKYSHLIEHRELSGLRDEVAKAKHRRNTAESRIGELCTAFQNEEFQLVLEHIQIFCDEDPEDETTLGFALTVTDSYTKRKVSGIQSVQSSVDAKINILNQLLNWVGAAQQGVQWEVAQAKVLEHAHRGSFSRAKELLLALLGDGDKHQTLLNERTWSLGHLYKYYCNVPLAPSEINSIKAKTIIDKVNAQIGNLSQQVKAGEQLLRDLEQNEKMFTQILRDLEPLVSQVNKSSVWEKLTGNTAQKRVKVEIARLVQQGRKLCPHYSAFADLS